MKLATCVLVWRRPQKCFMHEKDADFYLFQQDLYVSVTFVYTKYDEDGKFCVLFPIESAS